VTFSPFAHVPRGAAPSPPPSIITVTGRAITNLRRVVVDTLNRV